MQIEMTETELSEAMSGLGNPGRCVACGAEADGCEPDARLYKCDDCGERAVFGIEELLILGGITIV